MTGKRVRVVLNRKAVQEQILYSKKVGEACAAALGGDAVIEESSNALRKGRVRARVYGSLPLEAATGYLSKKLGGGS